MFFEIAHSYLKDMLAITITEREKFEQHFNKAKAYCLVSSVKLMLHEQGSYTV